MLRLVLKPLLVILTLGALLVALAQVAGRIAFTYLHELEPAVNRVLAERGVVVHGLSGDWRMLNPIVRAARVDLPAGRLEGLELEMDAVESVLRGTPLARRLKVADGSIALEKRPGEPWRPLGATGVNEIEVGSLLEESDQLELRGNVVLHREGHAPAEIGYEYLGLNRGGEHRHALELRNHADACQDQCRLQVDFHSVDALWPVRPDQTRLTARSSGFLVPRPVLGISPVVLAELDLAWQRSDEASGGTLRLRTEQFNMPGDVTLALELDGALRGVEGVHTGSVADWRVEQGDEVWSLPEMAVSADSTGFALWMPHLDLARASQFLRHALSALEPAERWLEALNLQGTGRNLRVAYGFDGAGLSYALTLDSLGLDGYRGVPTVRNAGGELFGFERGLQVNLNAQDMGLAFPDVFTDQWRLPYAQGVLQAWFGPDYFGIRGLNLRAEAAGTRAAGGFAMTRPPDREGQRLLMLVGTERIGVPQAQRFVPYKLPDALQDWLLTAPQGGALQDVRLAYQGQFQEEPGELGRRLAMAASVRDGGLRYHPDWPEVTGVSGELAVSGPLVEMDVTRGRSADASVAGSRVRVVDNAAAVDVSLDAEAEAEAVLAFLRTTPLANWLEFVEPDWAADGPMRLSGELHVPLNAKEADGTLAEDGLAVRLRTDLEGVDLDLPGYRVSLEALDGSFRYRYPHFVDASGVTGRLFDQPVTLGADTRGNRVHLSFDGRARAADVWRLIDVADPGIASGAFAFQADLGIGVANDAITEMKVATDLDGVDFRLPGNYGKAREDAVPTRVQVSFRPDYRAARFTYRDAAGWLHFDQAPLRGGIRFGVVGLGDGGGEGIGSPFGLILSGGNETGEGENGEDETGDSLVLSGRVERFELDEVIPDDDAGDGGDGPGPMLPLPIELNGLAAGEIGLGEFALTGAMLDGRITRERLSIRIDSAEVTGTVEQEGEAPLELRLPRVRVPGGEGESDDASDPLSPDLIADLPAADVVIDELTLGVEDYGAWRFAMRPRGNDLVVRDLDARVRGVTIRSTGELVWQGDTDETSFQGTLTTGNLAEVLPQWDYAPHVETASASLAGAFRWDGSPLMVDLLALRGDAAARAEQGRFLDVESGAGAQKIFSLLNFTAIAKRISLNFSDVFGRGVSFDELRARFALDEGVLTFLEPMQVDGTGSSFRVTGRVDLKERRLDNEMVVTLPVSKSLPWYAAYVALANPLAGLGVLVGERVLRKPLEQFSSARYHIGGTLDEPEVKLVSVFDVTPVEVEAAPGGAPAGAGDATRGAADADDANDTRDQGNTDSPQGEAGTRQHTASADAAPEPEQHRGVRVTHE